MAFRSKNSKLGYDRTKTTQCDLRTSMDRLAELFPYNRVLFCPPDIRVEKKIVRKPMSSWGKFRKWLNDPFGLLDEFHSGMF